MGAAAQHGGGMWARGQPQVEEWVFSCFSVEQGPKGEAAKGGMCPPPSLGGLRAGVLEESTHRLCLPKPCWKGWGTLLLHGALGSAVASAGAEGSGGGELQQERSAQEG